MFRRSNSASFLAVALPLVLTLGLFATPAAAEEPALDALPAESVATEALPTEATPNEAMPPVPPPSEPLPAEPSQPEPDLEEAKPGVPEPVPAPEQPSLLSLVPGSVPADGSSPGLGDFEFPTATPTPSPEGLRVESSLTLSAAEDDEAYPVDLPPGYIRVPFTVQTLSVSHPGGTSGGQLVCVMVDRQYVVDITPVPPELRPGVAEPITGFIYYSTPGQPTAAHRTAVNNSVGGSELYPGYPWLDLGNQYCRSVNYNEPTGDQFDWSSVPEVPDPWASDEVWNAYYLGVAVAKANQVVVWWNGSNLAPSADFSWELTDAGEREVTFTNTSADPGENIEALDALWDFGDGTQSTATHPVHSYSEPGVYTVTLTMTDDFGASDTATKQVTVSSGLVVNSTGDAPAEDPEAGCSTGDTVGAEDAPECTLRAAIETAEALGGNGITFDIEGSPVISLGPALPTITTATTIDGTTQSGGWVEVSGGGDAVLSVSDGTAELSGLALHGATIAVDVSGGSDHVLSGLRIGTDLSGASSDDTSLGIVTTNVAGTVIENNTITADEIGVFLVGSSGAAEVTGNSIGVTPAGAALGELEIGLFAVGIPTTAKNNTVLGTQFGVMVINASATGTEISGNRVGTNGTTAFPTAGTGIVVEGVPDAVVADNVVFGDDWGGILIAGAVMVEDTGGEFVFHSPSETELEGTVTGTGVSVTGNTVSTQGARPAIASWAGAAGLIVTGNTVPTAGFGVRLDEGAGHLVTDNVLGSVASRLTGTGVWLSDTSAATISGNTVFADAVGIDVDGEGAGVTISGNVVTGDSSEMTTGIRVDDERSGVSVTKNTVDTARAVGIELDTAGGIVTDNIVVRSGNGLFLDGAGLTLRDNLVGATAGLGSFPGNVGNGVVLNSGSATMTDNVVAGSGGFGILIDGAAVGTLRGNRIWDSTAAPIAGPDSAPTLSAAIIADTPEQDLTTLLVTGLPGTAGTLEIFANDSCEPADAEAKYATDVTRTTRDGRTIQIIQLPSSRDHFTITFTDTDGSTTALSECVSREAASDADGDGSPDPLDGLLSTENEPSIAVIATEEEQLLVAYAGTGQFENFGVVDDPAPSAHPAGWSLPYGTLSFRVTGLEPGGSTSVVLTTYFVDETIAGNSYWKYGPQTLGGASTWYDFTYDADSQTGAVRSAADVPGLGFRTTFTLSLADGARGDTDGGANGSVTDPGGPVIFAGNASPEAPDKESTDELAATGVGETSTAILWTAALALLLGAATVLGTARSRRVRSRK